jgi:predicted transcriptional regulator
MPTKTANAKIREAMHKALLTNPMTSGELGEKFGMSSRHASDHIKYLRRDGMVRTTGTYRNSAPVWTGIPQKPKPVEVKFVPGKFDSKAFAMTVKGTPWQGLERLV